MIRKREKEIRKMCCWRYWKDVKDDMGDMKDDQKSEIYLREFFKAAMLIQIVLRR